MRRRTVLIGAAVWLGIRGWDWLFAAAIVVLAQSAAKSQAPAQREPRAPLGSDAANPPLLPRAVLRVGTNDLRTRASISAFAFSPEGRFFAAADLLANEWGVVIWDVQTGRKVKQIVAPGKVQLNIQSLAFSPDGTKLLWGEHDGDVVLWDLPGNRLLKRDKLYEEGTSAVAFSPDGSLMAIAGVQAIQLRKVASPAEVLRELDTQPDRAPGMPHILLPPGRQWSLAFTPDGTRLVAGASSDAIIFIWRVGDGRLLRKIPDAHGMLEGGSRTGGLNCVAVTPDGLRVMSAGTTGDVRQEPNFKYGVRMSMSDVRLWDIETGVLIADYRGDDDYGVGYAALSSDGRRVAVGDSGRLRILDAATGRGERAIELPGVRSAPLIFSPDGTLIALPVHNSVGLFEVATGRRLHHDASTPAGYSASAGWSPSGHRIVTGHGDGFVRVWDAATGKLIWHKLLAPVISRGGSSAIPSFVNYSGDGQVVVVAGRRDEPLNEDGGIVATYESSSGRVVRELPEKPIRWAALGGDGRMAVLASLHGNRDTHFLGVELSTGQTRWAVPPGGEHSGVYIVVSMQFESNSSWLDIALADGTVIRLNSLTGHEQRRFLAEWRTPQEQRLGQGRPPGVWEAAFSSDGRILVSSMKEWLYVWDTEMGKMLRKFRQPRDHRCRLVLSSDGRTLATSEYIYSNDYGEDTVRVFDIETAKQVLALEPGSRASVMAFSPDGTRLYSGGSGSSGVVWDVRQRRAAQGAKK